MRSRSMAVPVRSPDFQPGRLESGVHELDAEGRRPSGGLTPQHQRETVLAVTLSASFEG